MHASPSWSRTSISGASPRAEFIGMGANEGLLARMKPGLIKNVLIFRARRATVLQYPGVGRKETEVPLSPAHRSAMRRRVPASAGGCGFRQGKPSRTRELPTDEPETDGGDDSIGRRRGPRTRGAADPVSSAREGAT